MRKIYSCLDVGSHSLKLVVSEYFQGKFNVLFSIAYPSKGIKKGVVYDEELFKNDLKAILKEANKSLGIKIDKIITSIPIYDAEYKLVDGYTTISNESKIVKGNDMVNALQASVYNKIEKDKELVTVIPIKYIINDDEKLIVKQPRGINAEKLKVFSMMITVPKKYIYKIVTIIESIGVQVTDILFGSLGDYTLFKDEKFDNSTVGIINIGEDKTELSTFNNGIITNSTIIQEGSSMIDSDISYVYNISKSKSKKIKEIFALASTEYASQNEIYEIVNKSQIKTKISQYEVSKIIENRLSEILQNAKKEINHLTKKEISYIIITGGISNIPGFDLVAKEVFGNSYVSKSISIIGVRDNSYSSAIGLIMYFFDKLKIRGKEYSMFDEEKEIELIDTKKNDNIFGKVFDYLIKNKED